MCFGSCHSLGVCVLEECISTAGAAGSVYSKALLLFHFTGDCRSSIEYGTQNRTSSYDLPTYLGRIVKLILVHERRTSLLSHVYYARLDD